MNLKDFKIGTLLKLSFSILILLTVVLGTVSYYQSSKIHEQTETMYLHPVKVLRAVGTLKADIISLQRDLRHLTDARNETDASVELDWINWWLVESSFQIDSLFAQYLGPRYDVELTKQAFERMADGVHEVIRHVQNGENKKAIELIKTNSILNQKFEEVLEKIKVIDIFATAKGDQLYTNSKALEVTLNKRLVLLVLAILLVSILINYILLKNIRKPIEELTNASLRFHKGDLNARSSYKSKNEFGELSASFNNLAEGIQTKTDLDEKFANLASQMLSEYDIKKFFQATINSLAECTGSQMAAIYLLSEDNKTFDHFESTGLDDNARQSFAADRFEGEFGAAISSRKVQHIKNIPHDTRFVFHTVSGKFIPHEIITLPILADNQVVAIISLASVNEYSQTSIKLIDRILVTLCARVDGILAYHKIKNILQKLEIQNRELEAQKTELSSQSAELLEQNVELEMQKKQLGEASRLKTNFLSNMSHELRTPLNSVIALSGVLNRRLSNKIPADEYSYIEVIERNGKHLLSLINDILDISRIEAGKEEVVITKFDVTTLISDVVSMIQPQADQKSIELLHTDNDSDISITNDADKCRHILQNLIGNAVKFTEKGQVVVKAQQSANYVLITVADTGIGISEKHILHIFDEFRQADGSTSRKFGGTGLGLAIAKKYANLLGGNISVKSSYGNGSEFTLTLPMQYTEESRIIETDRTTDLKYTLKPTAAAIIPDPNGKTILLVEDSEPAIIQLKDILEESGYNLLIARDGGEALGIISQTIPDAMILDLMMPGIDGFEVLKTIRNAEATAHIPVLILTAKHITKDELKFLKRNNIHELIQKGDIKRNELLNAVSSMVPTESNAIKTPRKLQNIKGKPIVLAVEDNPDNMLTVKAILAQDFTVIEATDGKEGIALAKKHLPNLILMDIALPGMDGIEAFKIIRNDPRLEYIPIIALTASAMVSDRETILAHGFDAYIPKPIDEHIFFKTIKETLYGG